MEGQKMKWPYRCKDCGAYLDPEEICDCKKADELQLNRLKEGSTGGTTILTVASGNTGTAYAYKKNPASRVTYTGNDLQSVGLGKYNYTRSTGTDGTSKQSSYAPRAIRILARTGLLYRGGGCYAIHP